MQTKLRRANFALNLKDPKLQFSLHLLSNLCHTAFSEQAGSQVERAFSLEVMMVEVYKKQ
jgi:hypothetical protein